MRLAQFLWLILGLLFLSTVINYLDRQALSVLLPTLRKDFGALAAPHLLTARAAQFDNHWQLK